MASKTLIRTAEHLALWREADAAGRAAAEAAKPTPMTVVERENPLDDSSPVQRSWGPYAEGVCGFAWINVRPGTSSFARWLKKAGIGRTDSYYGGVTIWISAYNQSYERKLAHADAAARVLREAGIEASGQGRLD